MIYDRLATSPHVPRHLTALSCALILCGVFGIDAADADTSAGTPATIVVATVDSSEQSKAAAQFVCDGQADQEEINAAIRALPAIGGHVLLMEGTYDIRRVEGTLGGVIIDRSDIQLSGQGTATKLRLAARQDTNVIRIIGSGVGHVTIRDLIVDANREQNSEGMGDPDISHDRFEFCGIKAFRQAPRGPTAPEDTHDITIRNCIVRNAHRLGIMLEGPNMRVLDNHIGNAGSDSVEILTGPGIIRGNYFEITGQTHVAVGSDRANSIIMSENIVHIRKEGALDIGFRSWTGSKRHVISDNVLTVEEGGRCTLAMDVRGTETTVTGNNIQGPEIGEAPRLRIAAGNAIVTSNVIENAVIEIDDQTGGNKPIRVEGNILEQASVVHRQGRLLEAPEPSASEDSSTSALPTPFRGVYVHLQRWLDPKLEETELEDAVRHELARMQRIGINAILPFVTGSSGEAHYPSKLRREHTYGEKDPVAIIVREARACGLAVFPVICVAVSGHQTPAGILKEHPDWAMRHPNGDPAGFISPAHPDARIWIVDAVREVLDRYEPDGLVLDYLRYENRPLRLDEQSERRFRETLPSAEGTRELEASQFQSFKEAELTELVRQISQAARVNRPQRKLAAYCWGAHVTQNHQIAQVWPQWVEQGYLDMINISGYYHHEKYGDQYLEKFEHTLSASLELNRRLPRPAIMTFSLGLKTSHGSVRSTEDVRLYLEVADRLAMDGVVYFTWEYLQPYYDEIARQQ